MKKMKHCWTDWMNPIKKGEIYLANLGDVKHTDIGKIRPVLVFQNDMLNRMVSDGLYNDVIVIPLSSKIRENDFTLYLPKRDRLEKKSVILCNAMKMISAKRLMTEEGVLTQLMPSEMEEIEKRVLLLLGI